MLTFEPGVWRLEFEVAVVDDDEVEDVETVQLLLSRGSDLFPLGGQNSAVLSIRDNDSLLSTGTNALGGVESDPEVVVTLLRSGPVEVSLSARFQTANADAVAGVDFSSPKGRCCFRLGNGRWSCAYP
jgi:hypothetical protein